MKKCKYNKATFERQSKNYLDNDFIIDVQKVICKIKRPKICKKYRYKALPHESFSERHERRMIDGICKSYPLSAIEKAFNKKHKTYAKTSTVNDIKLNNLAS